MLLCKQTTHTHRLAWPDSKVAISPKQQPADYYAGTSSPIPPHYAKEPEGVLKAMSLLRNGKTEQALLQANVETSRSQFTSCVVWAVKAESERLLGRYSDSIKSVSWARMAGYTAAKLSLGEAISSIHLNAMQRAENCAQTAIVVEKNNASAHALLAEILLSVGKSEEGTVSLQRALLLNPCDTGALRVLERRFQKNGSGAFDLREPSPLDCNIEPFAKRIYIDI